MSRTRRKHPIVGIAVCRGERADKRAWHRAYRRAVRLLIGLGAFECLHATFHREFSNPWHMGKDGKAYGHGAMPALLRK